MKIYCGDEVETREFGKNLKGYIRNGLRPHKIEISRYELVDTIMPGGLVTSYLEMLGTVMEQPIAEKVDYTKDVLVFQTVKESV